MDSASACFVLVPMLWMCRVRLHAQEAVEELATDPPAVIDRLRPTLRDLKDLDPAIASLHNRRIQPSRLFSLLGTMRKVK